MSETESSSLENRPIVTPIFEITILGHFTTDDLAIEDTGQSLLIPPDLQSIIEDNWQRRLEEGAKRGLEDRLIERLERSKT